MPTRFLTTLTLTAAVLLAGATAAHAQLWRCPTPGGGHIYQGTPCGSAQTEAPTATPPLESSADTACTHTGEMAFQVVLAHNRGVALDLALATATRGQSPTLPEGMHQYMRAIVLEVYQKTWWTPQTAQQQVAVQCVRVMQQALGR